jgi:hypothetical protein
MWENLKWGFHCSNTSMYNFWDIVEKKNLLPLLGTEQQFLGHPAHSLVTRETELYQFPFYSSLELNRGNDHGGNII